MPPTRLNEETVLNFRHVIPRGAMKKSSKSRSAVQSVSTSIPIPLAPVSMVLGGMISTLQGMVGAFERPIDAEIGQLIKLTTALRDQAGSPPPPPKKRK